MADPIAIGRIADFPAGEFRILRIANREIGVLRLPDGQFRAVLNRCPHRGAPVCKGIVGGTWPPCLPGEMRFEKEGEVLTCPWHGWEFDLRTGHELFHRPAARLQMFETSVADDVLSVLL